MWEFIKDNSFIVGAVSGSLAAYLLGLIVSHLRREKRRLGYSRSSRNIVQWGHAKLRMMYDNKDIIRLDSHAVVIRYIGNRPLVNLPIRIETADGEIVEHEAQGPPGACCEVKPDGRDKLIVDTDLINPGEVVTVGLTVADATESEIKVIARGELLEVREIDDRASNEELLDALLTHDYGRAVLNVIKLFQRW